MRRSEVASKAAEHRRVADSLAATASNLQCNDGGLVELPLHLDLLPALLQYLIAMRTGIEEHVAYQSLERLCLQAVGLLRLMPPARYEHLVEFETLLRAQFGEAVVHMLHGQGWSAAELASGSMDAQANAAAVDLSNAVVFLANHNSGVHAPGSIQRALPAADLKGGAQLHTLLNFFEAAMARGKAVTFSPAQGSIAILCDMGADGMMLGAGTMVDEHALKVIGLRRRVGYKEACRVLEMDDTQLAVWLAENPALQTALEFMISTADHSTTGHIGYEFVVSEGDHKQAARSLAEMVSYTRVCYGCLKREWVDGMTVDEERAALQRAKARCDCFCGSCAAGDEGCHHTGEHWTKRRCTACTKAGTPCYKLLVLGAAIDCGGNQAGLINRSFEGRLEDVEEPYHESGGARLYGLPILPDGAHFNKSIDSNTYHNKLWLDGWLCGAFQLYSRYWDADPDRRAAVRSVLTRELLRRKNAFSVEASVARRDRPLLAVLLSAEEHKAEEAPLVSTLGPVRDRLWRENTANMYGRPLGAAYHPSYNLLFYVDAELRQLRVLKFSHTPADNAPVTSTRGKSVLSQLRNPVCVALIGDHTYITDESTSHPALYVIDIGHIGKSFGTAEEGANGASGKGGVRRVDLSGPPIGHPHGLVAVPEANELFFGCRQRHAIMLVTLGSAASGVMEVLTSLPAAPSGLDVIPATNISPMHLVVACGDAIYCVNRQSKSCECVVRVDEAAFIGVSIAPAALGGALYAIDYNGNAVLRFKND